MIIYEIVREKISRGRFYNDKPGWTIMAEDRKVITFQFKRDAIRWVFLMDKMRAMQAELDDLKSQQTNRCSIIEL
jgi:hypothetical protein